MRRMSVIQAGNRQLPGSFEGGRIMTSGDLTASISPPRCSVLGDRLARAGHPLKPRTIQIALGELEQAGLAAGSEESNGRARYWSPIACVNGDDGGAVGSP